MRAIERKILGKITEKGFSLDQIEEYIDRMDRREFKKNYPDECLFQKPRYFAKQIFNNLLRTGLVTKENDRLVKKPKKT